MCYIHYTLKSRQVTTTRKLNYINITKMLKKYNIKNDNIFLSLFLLQESTKSKCQKLRQESLQILSRQKGTTRLTFYNLQNSLKDWLCNVTEQNVKFSSSNVNHRPLFIKSKTAILKTQKIFWKQIILPDWPTNWRHDWIALLQRI